LSLSRAPTFFCGFCRYRATRSDSVVLHVRSHTGEKPHRCLVCGHAFTTRSAMKRHMITRHGQFP
jgi:KRAB domain-containing zinc finger protein